MPKKVDHEQRRQELTEAFGRVVARDGLCAASYRAVASEADVSVKRVQYYFATKADLLAEALQRVGDRIVGRGIELMEEAGPDSTPRQLLHAAVAGTLPVDDESRLNSHLFYSFYVAAITDPELASAEAIESQRWTVSFVADLIRQGQDLGQASIDLDADHEGLVFMMTVYGLCLSVLAGHVTTEAATSTVNRELDRLFSGSQSAPST
jgi:AcrR family transcriptional regulator